MNDKKNIVGYVQTGNGTVPVWSDNPHPTLQASDPKKDKVVMTATLRATKEKGVYKIHATRVGAHAYSGYGVAMTWTLQALQDCATSWVGGGVSVNHNGNNYGMIEASEFVDPFVDMTIRVTDELDGWIQRNIESGGVGVSIEADLIEADWEKQDILKAVGTGVAIVLYPERPACSAEEGCGIAAGMPSKASAQEGTGSPATDKSLVNEQVKEMANEKQVEAKKPEPAPAAPAVVASEVKEVQDKLAAAEQEKAALAAKIAELEASNTALIAKEKENILASLKAKVGEKFADYEGMKVCELRMCAKIIKDYEAVLEKVPEVSSGVSGDAVKASETQVPADKNKESVNAALKVAEQALGRKLTE